MTDDPRPRSANEGPLRVSLEASDQAQAFQALRDQHFHYYLNAAKAVRHARSRGGQNTCPYPGLAAFDVNEAQWFFGRDALVAEACQELDAADTSGGIVLMVAPSGAGKSSALRAGVIPALLDGALPSAASGPEHMLTFAPGQHPLESLAFQIAAAGADEATDRVAQSAADLVRKLDATPDAALNIVLDALGIDVERDQSALLLVVVDQLEELFTLCHERAEQEAFVRVLDALSSRQSGQKARGLVVGALRADVYGECVRFPALFAALQRRQIVVPDMTEEQLREAIVLPALEVGLEVEPGLTEMLLQETFPVADRVLTKNALTENLTALNSGVSGRLPHLAYALRRTWQRRDGHVLTLDGYRATGGIEGAIQKTAEQAYLLFDDDGQRVVRLIFLRLIRVSETGLGSRRSLSSIELFDGLPDSAHQVLDEFVRNRLITIDADTVQIAHESLIYAWPRLRGWVEEDRAGNLQRQQLEDDARHWLRQGKDRDLTYRGGRLETSNRWASAYAFDLDGPTQQFLAASNRGETRRRRLRAGAILALILLTVATSTSAVVAFAQRGSAVTQRREANYRQLVAEADRLADRDASLSSQLYLAAYKLQKSDDVYSALINSQNVALAARATGHTAAVKDIALRPDGRLLASASEDRTIRLWDVTVPTKPRAVGTPLSGHTDSVDAIAFTPDGKHLFSAARDKTIRVWDVSDPTHPTPAAAPITFPGSYLDSLAISPDASILAAGNRDGHILLWDISTPGQPRALGNRLNGGSQPVLSVSFSPDGTYFVSGSADNNVRFWRVLKAHQFSLLGKPSKANGNTVVSVAFSPDGSLLAAAGGDGTVRLYGVSRGKQPDYVGKPIVSQGSATYTVAFSPDGNTLAAGGADDSVQLFNIEDPSNPRPIGQPLAGHDDIVDSASFSLDGRTLFTGSRDSTLRSWTLPSSVLLGHLSTISGLAFTPARHLISGSDDNSIRVWNSSIAGKKSEVGRFNAMTNAIVLTSDGRTLISGNDDGTLQLWSVGSNAALKALGGPVSIGQQVSALAVSPNGKVLATGGFDHLVRLWDISDPRHVVAASKPLVGHTDTVNGLAFTTNSRTLASVGGDKKIRLWDVSVPSRPWLIGQPLQSQTNVVFCVAISPNGKIMATGSGDNTIRLWDISDPTRPVLLPVPLTGHSGFVYGLSFSPDGSILASGGSDKTIRLWRVGSPDSPKPLGQPLTAQDTLINAVSFDRTGKVLASGGLDGSIFLWQLDQTDAATRICGITSGIPDQTEREQYLPGEERAAVCI